MTQKVRYTLSIPVNLSKAIGEISENKGVSKNALMLEILWKYLESYQEQTTKKKYEQQKQLA